jgi:hypothetical protein
MQGASQHDGTVDATTKTHSMLFQQRTALARAPGSTNTRWLTGIRSPVPPKGGTAERSDAGGYPIPKNHRDKTPPILPARRLAVPLRHCQPQPQGCTADPRRTTFVPLSRGTAEERSDDAGGYPSKDLGVLRETGHRRTADLVFPSV